MKIAKTNFMMKNNKTMPKKFMQPCSCILYSELVPPTCDVTCSKPKRDEENVSDKKLSVENILHITQDLSLSSIFFFNCIIFLMDKAQMQCFFQVTAHQTDCWGLLRQKRFFSNHGTTQGSTLNKIK